jgi:hypothetical protein
MTDKNALAAQIRSSLNEAKGGSFVIQAGHVTPLYVQDKEFASMAYVFPALFSENDESAWIFWNEIPVRFHYTYEFYANWDDLLVWLQRMKAQPAGEHELTLSTDIFFMAIRSVWKNGTLQLLSEWTAKKDAGKLMAETLNSKNEITLPVNDFIQEWKTLIYQVVRIFEKAGILLTDPAEHAKIALMKKIAVSVEGAGKLYTKQE